MRSLLLPVALATVALTTTSASWVTSASDDEGGGATEIPDAHINEASLGTYWYGAPLDLRDLAGKVVLWETWGS